MTHYEQKFYNEDGTIDLASTIRGKKVKKRKESTPLSKLTGRYNWDRGRVRFMIQNLRGTTAYCGVHIETSIQMIEDMCYRHLELRYRGEKLKLSGGT